MVTGASGFIGRNLVSKLSQNKNKIIEVSLNNSRKDSFYSRMNELPNTEFIIHLGEQSVRHVVNEIGFEYLKESQNIINKLISLSGKKIIYISSSLVYGDKSKEPCNVSDKLYADDIYLKSKIMRNLGKYCFKMLKYNRSWYVKKKCNLTLFNNYLLK